MNHRDQLRLALEMQNGVLDKFVQARMAYMDRMRLEPEGDDEADLSQLWHAFIDMSRVFSAVDWAGPQGDRTVIAQFWHEARFARRAAAS